MKLFILIATLILSSQAYSGVLGLDSEGYPAICSSGIAQSITREGGFMLIKPRIKDSRMISCMTKEEAEVYMNSIGARIETMTSILDNYPNSNKWLENDFYRKIKRDEVGLLQ